MHWGALLVFFVGDFRIFFGFFFKIISFCNGKKLFLYYDRNYDRNYDEIKLMEIYTNCVNYKWLKISKWNFKDEYKFSIKDFSQTRANEFKTFQKLLSSCRKIYPTLLAPVWTDTDNIARNTRQVQACNSFEQSRSPRGTKKLLFSIQHSYHPYITHLR